MNDEKKPMTFTQEVYAGFTHITIDPGDHVLCDSCNEEYMDSEEKGGILFQSKAICPKCVPRWVENIKKYNEETFIADRAREGETFRDFVYRLRRQMK